MPTAGNTSLVLALTLFSWPVSSAAQEVRVIARELARDASYWTADRVRSARPRPLPGARDLRSPRSLEEDLLELARRPSRDWAGRGPAAGFEPRRGNFLFEPGSGVRRHARLLEREEVVDSSSAPLGEVESDNRGVFPFDFDFSSSRLVPEEARLAYPYRTVGLLLFRDGSESFACSGTVISARLVLTAAHCVFDPETDTFFTDFLFVPAYYRGEAPFGSWTSSSAAVTSEWADGDGDPINPADFAVLVIADQEGIKIGEVTGWLGYQTNSLVPNHVHMLAYPGNHDNGERMHQVTSGSWDCCFDNNAIYGSDMGAGSSGGPWVQNFGVKARGQKGGKNKKVNRVVGVTSFGPIDERERYQGSSILGSSFVSIFNEACGRAAGNCSRKGRPKAN